MNIIFWLFKKYKKSAQNNKISDDLEYLKKTVSKEGKYLSDDFIKYQKITDKFFEDEDFIINNLMNIIKVLFNLYKY